MLLPPTTNADYRGHPGAAWFLILAGCFSIVPGGIHYLLPDGGAGIIAGIDLSTRGTTIVAMFAWMGALQIPHGIAQVVIGARYRPLVPLFLALVIVERALMAIDGWLLKGADAPHHPPEHYGSLVAVVLTAVALRAALIVR